MTIRVILIEAHALLREGVSRLLSAQPDIEVVATFESGRDALGFLEYKMADIAVIDAATPDLTSTEIAVRIRETSPRTRTLVLSTFVEPEYVYQALLAGVQGYIAKDVATRELIDAVFTVHAGRRFLCPQADSEALRRYIRTGGANLPLAGLSPRERQVLQLTVEGCNIAETASRLGISPKSVGTYRGRLMRKLGLEDIPALVKFAIRHGITSAR